MDSSLNGVFLYFTTLWILSASPKCAQIKHSFPDHLKKVFFNFKANKMQPQTMSLWQVEFIPTFVFVNLNSVVNISWLSYCITQGSVSRLQDDIWGF